MKYDIKCYFLLLGWVVIAGCTAKSPASTAAASTFRYPASSTAAKLIGTEECAEFSGNGLVTATTEYNQ